MSGGTNIFNFLHTITAISQNDTLEFISNNQTFPPTPEEKYVGDLIDFLQTADDDAIRKLNVLARLIRDHINLQSVIPLSKENTSRMDLEAAQPQFLPTLLGGFYTEELGAVQQALRDNEIGNIVRRKLPDLLIKATNASMRGLEARTTLSFGILTSAVKVVKKKLDKIHADYISLEEEARNSPPVVYQVFSNKPYKDLDVSFSSFAHAREFIREARENKSDLDNKNAKEIDFFVVEIQARNADELAKAKQAFGDNYSLPREQSSSWPNDKINSITFFTPGKMEDRQYNPNGINDIARTIKQLNLMITRLQQTNWFWRFIETVTGRGGLTDKKIQALKEIKEEVFMQKSELENNTKSLRDVLNNQLNQQATPGNKTTTYRSLLHEQRFGFSQKPTTTDEKVDELIQGTKPKQ